MEKKVKLIIEIGESDYEAIKNDGVQSHIALADEIIKNGIPYNPAGDLTEYKPLDSDFNIRAAEALKTAIEEHFDNLDAYFSSAFIKEIDNAPTVPQVTVFAENADEKAVADLKAELENVIEARPQGEWIDYDNTFYECPECGYLLNKLCPQCHNEVILPSCGRMMKGGAE